VKVTPGTVVKYQGNGYLRDIDLEALSRAFILPETEKSRLTGIGNLDVEFTGGKPRGQEESVLSTVRAAGQFEILRGDFWTIPILGDIAGRVAKHGLDQKQGPGTVGEAAGFFE